MYKTPRALFFPVPACTLSRHLLAEYLFHRMFSSFGFLLCTLYTFSMPSWKSSYIILSDSVFSFKLSTEVFFSTTMCMLDAHLAELHRTYNKVLSATVFQLHSLASKVFNNLEFILFLSY
jgi:hypothetical protein